MNIIKQGKIVSGSITMSKIIDIIHFEVTLEKKLKTSCRRETKVHRNVLIPTDDINL